MVTIKKTKLIIEIDTDCPIDDLEAYQKGIIEALKLMPKEAIQKEYNPVSILSDLLSHLIPTYKQLKAGFSKECESETSE
jgi:hypothetical protein